MKNTLKLYKSLISLDWKSDSKVSLNFQNCGPRPQGPLYPIPLGSGDPHENQDCDVIKNSTYISAYKCSGQCQMDRRESFTPDIR